MATEVADDSVLSDSGVSWIVASTMATSADEGSGADPSIGSSPTRAAFDCVVAVDSSFGVSGVGSTLGAGGAFELSLAGGIGSMRRGREALDWLPTGLPLTAAARSAAREEVPLGGLLDGERLDGDRLDGDLLDGGPAFVEEAAFAGVADLDGEAAFGVDADCRGRRDL